MTKNCEENDWNVAFIVGYRCHDNIGEDLLMKRLQQP